MHICTYYSLLTIFRSSISQKFVFVSYLRSCTAHSLTLPFIYIYIPFPVTPSHEPYLNSVLYSSISIYYFFFPTVMTIFLVSFTACNENDSVVLGVPFCQDIWVSRFGQLCPAGLCTHSVNKERSVNCEPYTSYWWPQDQLQLLSNQNLSFQAFLVLQYFESGLFSLLLKYIVGR